MGQGSDAGSQTAASTPATGSGGHMEKSSEPTYKDDETSSVADEKVELLCNDQVRPLFLQHELNMTLPRCYEMVHVYVCNEINSRCREADFCCGGVLDGGSTKMSKWCL